MSAGHGAVGAAIELTPEITPTAFALYAGDCLEHLAAIPTASVDLVLADPPYGKTKNRWDVIIPFEPLWRELRRVAKPNAAFVFTASQPFASQLVCSCPELYRYEMVWEKPLASGQMNVAYRPLTAHESIQVFYAKQPIYNEQRLPGKPYRRNRHGIYLNETYGGQRATLKENGGYRHARSVLKLANPRIKDGHPTQKPVPLMRHLLRMYSNPDAVVLDFSMGYGTTGVAVAEEGEGRSFIGMELDPAIFKEAQTRVAAAFAIGPRPILATP